MKKYWKVTIIANTFLNTYESSCEDKDLAVAVSTLRTLEAAFLSSLENVKIEKVIVESLDTKSEIPS